MRLHFHRWTPVLRVVDCECEWPEIGCPTEVDAFYRLLDGKEMRRPHLYSIDGRSFCLGRLFEECARCGKRRVRRIEQRHIPDNEETRWVYGGTLPTPRQP